MPRPFRNPYILFVSGFFFILLVLLGSKLSHRFLSSELKMHGGEINEGVLGTPRFINPVLARPENAAEQDLTELIFSRLLSHKKNGEIEYKLAQNLEVSQDGKEYTLTLRDGITFSDGKEIRAEDVVFTIEKMKDPLVKSPYQKQWDGVEVEQSGEKKVTFKLAQAYHDFPYNLEIGVLPKHAWDGLDGNEFTFSHLNTHPIGSGNYSVQNISYTKDGIPTRYTLQKNSNSKAYIPRVTLSFFGNYDELTHALQSGKIQSLYGVREEDLPSLKRKGKRLYKGTLPRVFGIFFNEKHNALLKDPRVRHYLDASIHREELIQKVFNGYATPIDALDGTYQKQKKEEQEEYLKEAREKLESAGWKKNDKGIYEKDGKELSLTLSLPDIPELISVAEHVANQYEKQGILLGTKVYKMNDFKQKVIRQRDYEALLYGYLLEKPSDLYAFWHSSQILDPGLNISMYRNPRVDSLLEKLRKEGGEEVRSKIREMIGKDSPAVFLYSPMYLYLTPKELRGLDLAIRKRSDRFVNVEDWYLRTRKVWNWFVRKSS